jgi:hypothetical protein
MKNARGIRKFLKSSGLTLPIGDGIIRLKDVGKSLGPFRRIANSTMLNYRNFGKELRL